jgi:hypothetical protein
MCNNVFYLIQASSRKLKLRATNSLNYIKIPHMTKALFILEGHRKKKISSSFRRVYSVVVIYEVTVDIKGETV